MTEIFDNKAPRKVVALPKLPTQLVKTHGDASIAADHDAFTLHLPEGVTVQASVPLCGGALHLPVAISQVALRDKAATVQARIEIGRAHV